MRFLSKIRERQFAKKWGSTYNLSRAVLAGVLAAGCLMPGFAEAATFYMTNGQEDTHYTISGGNTATITQDISGSGTREIYWKPGYPGASVEGCTINVNNKNIEPDIKIEGGYTSNNGAVTYNTVTISGNTTFKKSSDIYGGWSQGSGDVTYNTVTISDNTTFGSPSYISPSYIYGGKSSDGNANNNAVEISGNTKFISTSSIYGGQSSDGDVTQNKVTIKDTSFEKISTIYGGSSSDGTAEGNSVIISGGTFKGFVYGGSSGETAAEGNSVIISGGTFNGNVDGGSSYYTANDNIVILVGKNATYKFTDTQGDKQTLTGGNINIIGTVYGGYAKSSSGTANANNNQVIISGGTITGDVIGGSSPGTANDNKVILVGENATYPLSAEQTLNGGKINITGIVYGSSNFSNQSGNAIHVYGSNTEVGGIAGFDKLHFFIDDQMTFGETMLTITGDTLSPDVTISKDNLAVKVTGKPKASGDKNTITLIHNESDNEKIRYSNDITLVPVEIGRLLTGEGSVALVTNENSKEDLVLTLNVEKTTVNENGKSLVETRAAAAFVVNNMSDFMLGTGMEQAKAAAGGVAPIDAGTMAPFAAVGGSNMRYTTGSYVDVNGWNGAVGFAKQADKLLFGVAVEHGRGNYDSYLDNGVHASGDIKSTGGVIFGEYKLDNGVHYDAALRAGRVKSDYSSTATSYDESSAYYGFSLGGGKELTVSDKATLDVYGRYYFSHTNGSDVSIATGEEIDFDAVNSHRLRIGGRYTTTLTEKSKAYAGLAWQYEFGGDAKAAINGYSAPTPSLQGHSAIVEAGYKLNAGKNLTLDFNLNGAMGKQRGIGGGIGAQWLF